MKNKATTEQNVVISDVAYMVNWFYDQEQLDNAVKQFNKNGYLVALEFITNTLTNKFNEPYHKLTIQIVASTIMQIITVVK